MALPIIDVASCVCQFTRTCQFKYRVAFKVQLVENFGSFNADVVGGHNGKRQIAAQGRTIVPCST